MDDKNEKIKTIEQQLKQKKNELGEKTNEIDSIQEELSQKELRKRELDDNIQLIETNKEIQKLDDSIKELENQLSEYGVHQNGVDEYSKCQQILNEYHKDSANLEGQLKGFEDEVSRCKRELSKPFVCLFVCCYLIKTTFVNNILSLFRSICV